MKRLVIIGGGSAGMMTAHRMRPVLSEKEWEIVLFDPAKKHYYQPGFLFYPFGRYSESDISRDIEDMTPSGVERRQQAVERIDAEQKNIILADEESLTYDILVIATGVAPDPSEVAGMAEAWHQNVHGFYTFEDAKELREALKGFSGGRLAVHVSEMPIKCPVAPLEFTFLADDYFKKRGIREKVEIVFVTPLDGAFTKPVASKTLGHLLKERDVRVEANFGVERVEGEAGKLVSFDEREVAFDLLVTIPPNLGDRLIERSGLGDDLRLVPADKHTLQANAHENVFVVGDAANYPTSKAGSVAHFQMESLVENIQRFIRGEELAQTFDGHANCFVESGDGKALLLDFNYDTQPLTGVFPISGIGPMQLLREGRLNHLGKLAFRWMYWNVLMRGKEIPFISSKMTMRGKVPAEN